ncbi:MAG: hypothetical protein KGJ54_07330 [Betaproteobacteria bacterium]|nr:hypothetical protein [Betaproteobacteria bacterium]
MSTEGKIRHLSLVYSERVHDFSERKTPRDQPAPSTWQQIDLFATERPDTVIYASLEGINLNSLLKLLERAHIRQIFDFREMPHLSFSSGSRGLFFDALCRLHVTYVNSLIADNLGQAKKVSEAAGLLAKNINNGPTMIFSDIDPNVDPDIRDINDSLSNSGLQYRPVYLDLQDAR